MSNELFNPNVPKDTFGRPTIGRRASWIVMAFPYMEQPALWDEWSSKFLSGSTHINPVAPGIEGLTCPSHPPEVPNQPWLAYVGNAGQAFSDTTRGDNHEYPGNGVFFDDNRNPVFGPPDGRGDGSAANIAAYPRIQMSLGHISSADGTSKTMMISENIHTFYWTYDALSQGDRYVQLDGTSNAVQDAKHLFGFVWKNMASNQPLPYERINGDKFYDQNPELGTMVAFASSPYGESYGYPSSNHPGGVNVAFCGGQVVSIAGDDGAGGVRAVDDVQPQ